MDKDDKIYKKMPTFIITSPKISSGEGEPEPDFIKIVDDFTEHFYNGDSIIKIEAFYVPCEFEGQKASLGQFLHNSIRNYVVAKSDKTNERKYYWAGQCITWITFAQAVKVIDEGESLMSKIKKSEEKNIQFEIENKNLQERLNECNERRQALEKEIEGMRKYFFPKEGGTFVGDVGK